MFIFDFFKKDKLPKSFRRALEPERDFAARTKDLFLAEFDKKFGVAEKERGRFLMIVKIAAAALVVFGAANGLAVYADKANVGPRHGLYPLKRYGELLRMAAAKKKDRPALNVEFAARRMAELNELESGSSAASRSEADSVREDMKKEMKESLKAVEAEDYPQEKLPSFCRDFGNFVGTESPDVEDILISHPRMTEKYQNKCADILEGSQSSDDGGNNNKE